MATHEACGALKFVLLLVAEAMRIKTKKNLNANGNHCVLVRQLCVADLGCVCYASTEMANTHDALGTLELVLL